MNMTLVRIYIAELYPRQYELVINGGKLVDDWANVADHCFAQAVAVEELALALGLSNYDRIFLVKRASCHDWKKRLEKCPQDFTERERMQAAELLKDAVSNHDAFKPNSPEFLLDAVSGKADFLSLIQFLIDDMTMGDKIVPCFVRINEVSQRQPNPAPEVEKQLGMPYWEAERNIARAIEHVVYAILIARRIPCNSIADIINRRLKKRFPNE